MAQTLAKLLPGCSTFTESLALILSHNDGQLPEDGKFITLRSGNYSLYTLSYYLVEVQKEVAQYLKSVVKNESFELFLKDEKKVLDKLEAAKKVLDELDAENKALGKQKEKGSREEAFLNRLYFQRDFVDWLKQIREIQLTFISFSDKQWKTMQLKDYAVRTMELFGKTRLSEIELIQFRSSEWSLRQDDPTLRSVYEPILALHRLCNQMPDIMWK